MIPHKLNSIPFTLVTTVFNEESRLHDTLKDLFGQSIAPDELIVVDAGSKDKTVGLLNEFISSSGWNGKVIVKVGCNVAEGRNLAIQQATYDLIVSTDFGCRYHPEWLHSLTQPFIDDQDLMVVGGAFTIKESEIITSAACADYILQQGYKLEMNENSPISSRSIAYRKKVWSDIGMYPEWLTLAADDLVFWQQIIVRKFKLKVVNKPFVYWIRHKTHKGFAKEAFRYGLGDGESRLNLRNFYSNLMETGLRHFWFMSLSMFVFSVLIPNSLLSSFGLGGMIVFLPGFRSYIRAIRNFKKLHSKKYHFGILLHAFYQIEFSRINYLKGYLKGLFTKDQKKLNGRKRLQEVGINLQ